MGLKKEVLLENAIPIKIYNKITTKLYITKAYQKETM